MGRVRRLILTHSLLVRQLLDQILARPIPRQQEHQDDQRGRDQHKNCDLLGATRGGVETELPLANSRRGVKVTFEVPAVNLHDPRS